VPSEDFRLDRAHLAASVPELDEPVRVRMHHTIFAADKAA
jgi:hypothetical protein